MKNMDIMLEQSLSEKEKMLLLRKSILNLGFLLSDWLRLPKYKKQFPDWISFSGEEKLRELFERKKGVIILTSHFGYWEFLFLCSTYLGFKCDGIAKIMHPEGLDRFATEMRSTDLVGIIKKRDSSKLVRKKLKEGGMIGFMMDQNMNDSLGVAVNLGKMKAGTLSAPALLAARYGIPVIACSVVRNNDNSLTFEVGDEIVPFEGKTLKEKIMLNTQAYSDEILNKIREKPDQWIWMHRRFKHTYPEIYK